MNFISKENDMSDNRRYIGFTVEAYQGLTPAVIIAGLRFIGIDFVEITKTVFKEIDAVVQRLAHVKTGFHLPLMHDDHWDLSCMNCQKEIDQLIENINRYKTSLNLQYVLSHPPEPDIADKDKQLSADFLFENLNKIDSPIFLENVPSLSPDKFFAFYNLAKEKLQGKLAGMCFDGPHYFVTGYDPIEKYRSLHENIGCIHLSDCYANDDCHLPFERGGTFPVYDFLNEISKNFSGYLTLEIKPNSLNDLEYFVQSYLKTLYYLDRKKYFKNRLRWQMLRPLVRRFVG